MTQTLRFDEDVMALFVGEANDLIFDRRTVARAGRFDLPRIHRRAMEIRSDQLVCERARVREMTKHLRLFESIGEDRERPWPIIAGGFLHFAEVDRVAIDTRRSAGLQTAEFETEPAQ